MSKGVCLVGAGGAEGETGRFRLRLKRETRFIEFKTRFIPGPFHRLRSKPGLLTDAHAEDFKSGKKRISSTSCLFMLECLQTVLTP